MRRSHRHPQGSEGQTKQKSVYRLGISLLRAEKAFREYLARVAMPSLYRYSRRGGSGDAVRSEMKTTLNDVVKVWVSIA